MSSVVYLRTLPRGLSREMFPVEVLEEEPNLNVRKRRRAYMHGFQLQEEQYEEAPDPLFDGRLTPTQELIWELKIQGLTPDQIAKHLSKPTEFDLVAVADVELALRCVEAIIH